MPSLRPHLGRDARSVACDGDMIDAAARGMLDRHPGSGVVATLGVKPYRVPPEYLEA